MTSPLNETLADANTVAELILTSISPLFLINGLVDLWQRHMETRNVDHDTTPLNSANRNYPNGSNGVNTHHDNVKPTDSEGRVNITWVKIVSAYVFSSFTIHVRLTVRSILKFILVVAFAAAIAAGVLLGKDLSTESQRKVIANLLKASYVMALGELQSLQAMYTHADPQPLPSSR